MPSIVVVGVINTPGKEARDAVIGAVTKVMHYAKSSEPGVLKYCATVPRDPSNEKTVYVIEEYADQAALDAHMSSKAVANILADFGANPGYFAAPGEVWTMDSLSSFTKSETGRVADPYVVLTTYSSKPEVNISDIRKNSSALSFTVLKDRSNESTFRTLEIYGSEKAADGISVKRAAGYFYKEQATAVL